ncbi:MAG: NAD-dependent epimerase/dehydratase family protein [Sphingobacteriaceae bacterium]
MLNTRTISILGCGWYGFALGEHLAGMGYAVKGSTTGSEKFSKFLNAGIQPYEVRFDADAEFYDPNFLNCDLLIISIPTKRGTAESTNYPDKIKRIKAASQHSNVKRIVFISSTAVYGDSNEEVTENTPTKPETDSGKSILAAENILKDKNDYQLTILRFAGLIGPQRDPARFFSGKQNIPNGKAPVNLVRLNDCIEVTKAIIQKDAFEFTFNVCADYHPQKMNFYTEAAIQSNLPLPQFINELKSWKIVKSVFLEKMLDYKINSLDL